MQLCRHAVHRALSTALAYNGLHSTTYIAPRSQVPCLASDAQVLGCGCPALATSSSLARRLVCSIHLMSPCFRRLPSGASLLPCARAQPLASHVSMSQGNHPSKHYRSAFSLQAPCLGPSDVQVLRCGFPDLCLAHPCVAQRLAVQAGPASLV